jgi:hypothetical protein
MTINPLVARGKGVCRKLQQSRSWMTLLATIDYFPQVRKNGEEQ